MGEKFLVIPKSNTGFAQIGNVCVVTAVDENSARYRALKIFGYAQTEKGNLDVFPLDDLKDGWSYFG